MIDDLFVQHLTGSVGVVNRWIELGVDLPVNWRFSFLNPNVAAPTGSSGFFLGDEKATFTESLLLESSPSDRLSLGLNVGFEIRTTFIFRDINRSDQLKFGLGAQFPPRKDGH